jgi:hypothetical protein
MAKKKIDVDEMVADVVKAKKKKPANWVDKLDGDAKEFMFKLRKKEEETGITIGSAVVIQKLKEHFGVFVSDTQVRRFLSGVTHAEEDYQKESSPSNR